jgi:Protein of unknown function (DUF2934)
MAKAAARPKAAPKAPRPARARTPRNGTNGGLQPEPEPNEDDIRVRAYHLYLERGAADGADFDDWVTAEKQLKVAHN